MNIKELNTKLEAINNKYEKELRLKIRKLYTKSYTDRLESHSPMLHTNETLWSDLITRKEHKFIREIKLTLNKSDTSLSREDACSIREKINNIFDEQKYLSGLIEFYKEIDTTSTSNKIDPFNPADQKNISRALRRAQEHVLTTIELYNQNEPNDLSMIELWNKYSTINPLMAVGTILLLYCTTLLIAWIIKSDVFQQYIQEIGWSVGAG
ncbi:MAG: hypothetical protein CMH70_02535 [Nitrosomonadaceae bacterium]|nr:hypothetical protein [Nitrosomonadaceae bacterium]|tara:strand:- start:4800 stop:5429 length:630 start_codon:yes stop_codon:yes gene_type:complete